MTTLINFVKIKNMNEDFITIETEKLAEEKGFFIENKPVESWAGTSQSLLQKWLRKKNIFVTVHDYRTTMSRDDSNIKTDHVSWFYKISGSNNIKFFPSYEEALEEGLKTALKSIN